MVLPFDFHVVGILGSITYDWTPQVKWLKIGNSHADILISHLFLKYISYLLFPPPCFSVF